MTDDVFVGSADEIADKAERLLKAIVPDAWCQAQEWDNRMDCGITLNDEVVAEMIPLGHATENRIKECGERLLMRQRGIPVDLVDELRRPIHISRTRSE